MTPALNLALQGGGSHGAFTWGVLDRLLEDETLVFSAISGASAGALNAAVLASGFANGGHAAARAALQAFWLDLAAAGTCFGGVPGGFGRTGLAGFNLDQNPLYAWFNQVAHSVSPYQFNPLGLN